MLTSKRKERTIICIYLLTELALFTAAKFSEQTCLSPSEGCFKYAAVVVNAAVAFCFYLKYGCEGTESDAEASRVGTRANLVAFALFATVVADFFLTFISTEEFYLPGIAVFCVVQLIYAAYLKPGRAWFACVAVLYAAALIATASAGMLNVLAALGALDIALISANTLCAWLPGREGVSLVFRIGITLFLACDVSILIRSVSTGALADASNLLIWTFYAPSQVLITLAYVQASHKEATRLSHK